MLSTRCKQSRGEERDKAESESRSLRWTTSSHTPREAVPTLCGYGKGASHQNVMLSTRLTVLADVTLPKIIPLDAEPPKSGHGYMYHTVCSMDGGLNSVTSTSCFGW
eukprot:m.243178 g.243178  ORF g.243178 m.243178 type:complete len:107 (+) comp26354_c2_seq4:587-907(+)